MVGSDCFSLDCSKWAFLKTGITEVVDKLKQKGMTEQGQAEGDCASGRDRETNRQRNRDEAET